MNALLWFAAAAASLAAVVGILYACHWAVEEVAEFLVKGRP